MSLDCWRTLESSNKVCYFLPLQRGSSVLKALKYKYPSDSLNHRTKVMFTYIELLEQRMLRGRQEQPVWVFSIPKACTRECHSSLIAFVSGPTFFIQRRSFSSSIGTPSWVSRCTGYSCTWLHPIGFCGIGNTCSGLHFNTVAYTTSNGFFQLRSARGLEHPWLNYFLKCSWSP